jgi:predicted DNA-binding transcriptional regulator YafY
MAKQPEIFTPDELEAIAKALGDTSEGLTGSEISHILPLAKLRDIDPAATKWKRIHNAFVDYQNQKRNRAAILAFIRKAIKPTRYRGRQDHFESMRHNLNGALSFCGLSVQEDGELIGSI